MARAKNIAQIVSLWLSLFLPSAGAAQTYFDFPEVTYHTCYDGDTCMVSLAGVHALFGDHILVRVGGVDTPEMKGKCEREKVLAKEARDYIRNKLSSAARIELKKAERDKYFRILAQVIADGEDIGQLLLVNGFAVSYHGGTKVKDWCAEDSGEAEAIQEPIHSHQPIEGTTRPDSTGTNAPE